MPARARSAKLNIRREDEIPDDELRPSASARPTEPPTAPPVEPAAETDLGDGRIPGTAAHALLLGQAERLTNVVPGTYLFGTLADLFGSALETHSYTLFLQQVVAQVAPADPFEQMMAEQMTLAHHALGRAHVKAAAAPNAAVAQVYYAAAIRLQSEFRQSLLAFKSYRAPSRPAARAAESAQVPLAPATPTEPGNGVPVPPIGDTKLVSKPENRLKELFDELATTGS